MEFLKYIYTHIYSTCPMFLLPLKFPYACPYHVIAVSGIGCFIAASHRVDMSLAFLYHVIF